eukprot:TRINITY_DN74761_c0_g1_i1.p1 TRINITY_DN74761_c0_g1~~TRINITY_DN74761_c0_g1_i1.p1  ORF type:complete len:757 (-),score=127.34 TRINITY_DN74761_c0_g1_i1:197-2359(-)
MADCGAQKLGFSIVEGEWRQNDGPCSFRIGSERGRLLLEAQHTLVQVPLVVVPEGGSSTEYQVFRDPGDGRDPVPGAKALYLVEPRGASGLRIRSSGREWEPPLDFVRNEAPVNGSSPAFAAGGSRSRSRSSKGSHASRLSHSVSRSLLRRKSPWQDGARDQRSRSKSAEACTAVEDPARVELVNRVRLKQRNSKACNMRWQDFCEREGRGIFDPNRHDNGFLEDFLLREERGLSGPGTNLLALTSGRAVSQNVEERPVDAPTRGRSGGAASVSKSRGRRRRRKSQRRRRTADGERNAKKRGRRHDKRRKRDRHGDDSGESPATRGRDRSRDRRKRGRRGTRSRKRGAATSMKTSTQARASGNSPVGNGAAAAVGRRATSAGSSSPSPQSSRASSPREDVLGPPAKFVTERAAAEAARNEAERALKEEKDLQAAEVEARMRAEENKQRAVIERAVETAERAAREAEEERIREAVRRAQEAREKHVQEARQAAEAQARNAVDVMESMARAEAGMRIQILEEALREATARLERASADLDGAAADQRSKAAAAAAVPRRSKERSSPKEKRWGAKPKAVTRASAADHSSDGESFSSSDSDSSSGRSSFEEARQGGRRHRSRGRRSEARRGGSSARSEDRHRRTSLMTHRAEVEEFVRLNGLDGTAAEKALEALSVEDQKRVLGTDGGQNRSGVVGGMKLPDSVRNPVAVVISRCRKLRDEVGRR